MRKKSFRDIFKIFLFISLSFQSLYAVSTDYYKDKFKVTKKLYLGAIMSNNKSKEIKYLKKIIHYGDKININTLKYKRELNRLDKSVSVHKPVKTNSSKNREHLEKTASQQYPEKQGPPKNREYAKPKAEHYPA